MKYIIYGVIAAAACFGLYVGYHVIGFLHALQRMSWRRLYV